MAMARYGRPDGSSIAFGELANTNASIRESVSLPLIIDACGGFGNSLNVLRVVRLFERAGASAIALSDEVITGSVQEARRERVVAAADMIGKLKAALDARSDCLIIARTLAARTEGSAAAFDRAEAYLEAGADLLIINAAPEHFRVEAIAKRFAGRAAVIHDYGFGHSSDVGALELEALGYSAVLKPTLLLDAMSAATPRLGSGPKPIRPRLSESRQAAILGLDTLQSASEPRARRR
jgi:2-methylisocitrate lyase-like PEP mutase family enzyme